MKIRINFNIHKYNMMNIIYIFIFIIIYYNNIAEAQFNNNWNQITNNAAFLPRENHSNITFNDKIWTIGGYSIFDLDGHIFINAVCDVWFSDNGTSWIQTNNIGSDGRDGHTITIFKNKIWVMGGYRITSFPYLWGPENFADIWQSDNGTNWTQVSSGTGWGERAFHTCLNYNNKLWIIGGEIIAQEIVGTPPFLQEINYEKYINDVWSSDNGTTWIQVTSNAAFSARVGHCSLIYNNKMWVIGGDNGNYVLNDVWWSDNGTTWIQATENATFPARSNHTGLVFDNKMWIIGGGGASSGYLNDIWWSNDGINWQQSNSNNIFSPRTGQSGVIYNNKAWIIGGDNVCLLNDVWNSSLSLTSSTTSIISQLNPATYTTDTLQVNKYIYEDNNYQFINPIPADLLNQFYIKTLDNDMDSTYISITFMVNQPASVIVALDSNITTMPLWLQGWSRRADMLTTTDPNSGRALYEMNFDAGTTITLGPNRDSNMPTGYSMYTVIVKPINNRCKDWDLYQ